MKEWRQWRDSIPQKEREYYGHFRSKPDKIFQTDNRTLISTAAQLRTGQAKSPPATPKTEGAAAAAYHHIHRHTSS